MSTITIDIYTTKYAPWEEGQDERTRLSVDEDSAEVERDPAAIALWLKTKGYAIEASSYPYTSATAHTWYSDEPYEHPYTGELEEKTFHPQGLTDEEARAVAELFGER